MPSLWDWQGEQSRTHHSPNVFLRKFHSFSPLPLSNNGSDAGACFELPIRGAPGSPSLSKVKSMPAQYRKIGTRLPAALLVSAAIATAQGTQTAPPPTQPAAGNHPAMMFSPLPNTALGQKAALMGSLAPKWNKVPNLEGTGPFSASY